MSRPTDSRVEANLGRMLDGSPLLKRVISRTKGDGSQQVERRDNLEIATFRLTEDLRNLDITSGKLAIAVKNHEIVVDKQSATNHETVLDEQSGMKTRLRLEDIKQILPYQDGSFKDYKSLKIVTQNETIEVICSTDEDYSTWYDGLTFLLRRIPPSLHAMQPSEPEILSPHAKIKKLEDTIDQFREEHSILAESLKRKDATIQHLLQDLMGGHEANPYNKTTNSSLESDAHHTERKMVLLKTKNTNLKNIIKQKQQVINRLLEVVRSSVNEEPISDIVGTDSDDDNAMAPQVPSLAAQARVLDDSRLPADVQRLLAEAMMKSTAQGTNSRMPANVKDVLRDAVGGANSGKDNRDGGPRDLTRLVDEAKAAAADRNEVARVVRDMMFRPPPRMYGGGGQEKKNGRSAADEFEPQRIELKLQTGPTPAPAAPHSAMINGYGAMESPKVTEALQKLELEMKKLDAKKTLVQRLAMTDMSANGMNFNDTGSDDGFPLR